MANYSCECGKATSTGGNQPAPCQGCTMCGTTLELPGKEHQTPKEHVMIMAPIKRKGEIYKRCENCAHLERQENPANATHRLLYETIRRLHEAEDHGFDFEACVMPICDGVIKHLGYYTPQTKDAKTPEEQFGGQVSWNEIIEAEKAIKEN